MLVEINTWLLIAKRNFTVGVQVLEVSWKWPHMECFVLYGPHAAITKYLGISCCCKWAQIVKVFEVSREWLHMKSVALRTDLVAES